ncbi:collagenase-like [Schistocerca americana]|uniref:collagenase-like n=1 Tax=Schistocerca americana TaxID=7009 RepID=UPI001F4FB104|nr:collagenase-like [Schistocerca americana]
MGQLGYQGTTSGPHDGSFVNGMVDGGDQEYDDSDDDADVGVTERYDVGDAGLHRVPTSEFDFTDLTKPVECRRMSISVRDQFQILKERRGLIARALHSRTAQNQSQLATFPIHGGRAVNARETAPGQFPYHTLVLADNRVLCGGALLSVSVVLTAAQCVFRYKTWLVQLGSVELLVQNPHRQLIEGKRVKTHPLYSDKRTNDDIAVVFLKTSAVLNSYVKTVRLPTDMMREDLVGRMGIVAGWGRTHVLSRCSQVLLYMPLVVDSNANCKAYFPNYNARTSFCAGGVYGASICNGDNGSPFTFGTTTGYVVIGVASFVFSEHCLTDFPTGFTRVTNYLTWISKTSGIKLT